jgi:hypothetical protein
MVAVRTNHESLPYERLSSLRETLVWQERKEQMSNQSKQLSPLFGVSLTPVAHEAEKVLHLSQVADASGLDLLAIQDHPYKPTFLDTWTLLSLIGGQTRQIRLLAGVSPIALCPPAMLAKAATSLDVLMGGRVEMGWVRVPIRMPLRALVVRGAHRVRRWPPWAKGSRSCACCGKARLAAQSATTGTPTA